MKILFALICFQLSLTVNAQNALPFLSDSIHSAVLNESRELRVILPKGYVKEARTRYEVLYILDGEWYQELVPFTYNFAEGAGYLPKSIFVLVRNRYSGGRNLRDRDFSPTHVVSDSLSGGADRFYDFLTREVVPYIEHKYPANGKRTLLGSSFGGLFSVYAFLKDPAFFQSYISCDPNINFDQHYVTRLAAQTLSRSSGTLFIAGRTRSYREGGVEGFEAALKAHAPKALHWQCIPYENETHYSVQLKAFYEGFRFSHYGYAASPPEFHPMNGSLADNSTFTVYFLNNNPSARFTVNGLEPTGTSPAMVRDDTVSITAPGQLRVKTFANRTSYVKEWKGSFMAGQLLPVPIKGGKAGLTYKVFHGSWDSLPDITSLKPVQSGEADPSLKLNTLLYRQAGLLVLEGVLDISQDAEYVFFTNGFDAVQLTVGGMILLKENSSSGKPVQSYIVSLKKGKYPLRFMLLHNTSTLEPHFSVGRSTKGNERWWENRVLDF